MTFIVCWQNSTTVELKFSNASWRPGEPANSFPYSDIRGQTSPKLASISAIFSKNSVKFQIAYTISQRLLKSSCKHTRITSLILPQIRQPVLAFIWAKVSAILENCWIDSRNGWILSARRRLLRSCLAFELSSSTNVLISSGPGDAERADNCSLCPSVKHFWNFSSESCSGLPLVSNRFLSSKHGVDSGHLPWSRHQGYSSTRQDIFIIVHNSQSDLRRRKWFNSMWRRWGSDLPYR